VKKVESKEDVLKINGGMEMKTLKVGVCFLDEDGKVVSKSVVGTNWSVDIEQDLKEKVDILFLDEIAEVLTENIKLQLTSDVIKQMLREVQEQN